ncbi:MAG: DUF285 domain-containing protein, partial [Elusimicrobiaceae bacterium]|nr:DUF285 domain-containing protein [Elusimicrobiaceae bacterium]
ARTNFNTLPNLDVSAVTNMSNCFNSSTTTASYDFTNWDTSDVTTMQAMFSGCQTITGVTNLDCSSVTNFQNMFINCKEITTVSLINYLPLYAIECSGMFNECRKLTSLTMPKIRAGNCINMFAQCQALETAPELDTAYVFYFQYMFYNCQELKNVPFYDASSASNFGSNNMFSNCTKLTDESLNNILAMCISATNYNGTKTFAMLGFTSWMYSSEKIQSLSNYTAFTNAGWTIGY